MKKNILIAFDDSENAMRAVEFVGNFFDKECSVTLFSVIPDSDILFFVNSPELYPYFVDQKNTFNEIEEKKKELLKTALEKASVKLVELGFDKERVETKSKTRVHGIARDIINESSEDFDVIVLGRRGLTAIKEFFLGSVSHKVFSSTKDISILVVN